MKSFTINAFFWIFNLQKRLQTQKDQFKEPFQKTEIWKLFFFSSFQKNCWTEKKINNDSYNSFNQQKIARYKKFIQNLRKSDLFSNF